MRTPLPFAAIVVLLLGVARPARAAMMEHTDLAGLAFQSDAIVAADRVGVTAVNQYVSNTTYRVTRVLAGSLAAGATLTLGDSGCVMDGSPYGAAHPLPLDRSVVLFLSRVQPDPRLPPEWRIVPSGLRVMSGGLVYRFEQWSNPGPYVPVPQGHDPEDARGGAPGATPVDLRAFEVMLAAAMARATAMHEALALTDVATRRARVVALLGAPVPPSVTTGRPGNFYEDVLAEGAATALATAGDIDGALEARARGRAGHAWPFLEASALVVRATDGSRPTAVRTAALDLMTMTSFTVADERAIADVAASAIEPEVRVAAMTFLGGLAGRSDEGGRAAHNRRRGVTAGVIATLRTHETDARVIAAVDAAARAWGLAASPARH
ncbi:MAG: hypothetical protein WCJ30_14050 [Deltaproteobacteria bacterium]